MAAPLRDLIVRLGHAWRRIAVAAGLVGILTGLFLDTKFRISPSSVCR